MVPCFGSLLFPFQFILGNTCNVCWLVVPKRHRWLRLHCTCPWPYSQQWRSGVNIGFFASLDSCATVAMAKCPPPDKPVPGTGRSLYVAAFRWKKRVQYELRGAKPYMLTVTRRDVVYRCILWMYMYTLTCIIIKKHVEFAPCHIKPSLYLFFSRYFVSGVDLNIFGSFGNPCSRIGGASNLSGLTSHTFIGMT